MKIKIHSEMSEISAIQWNAMVQDSNPFMRHEFLTALESNGCVGPEFGWIPCHIGVYEDDDVLCAAMPLYQKFNSYGEFVFDHAWADAYKRSGLPYFPKLVSATPYTPATGQRLLSNSDQPETHYKILMQTVAQFAVDNKLSSYHCLFPRADQLDWLSQLSLNGSDVLLRHDVQFHWHNQRYGDFEGFLAKLTAKKRKNIRQERKRMQQSGVQLRLLDGHTATDQDWEDFAFFYKTTFEEKWSTPTLNAGFFKEVAAKMPDQVFLVLADLPPPADNQQDQQDSFAKFNVENNTERGQCVAGSLMFRSDTRLYGRHWGCTHQIDKLHFEACYYQGIEYCIRNHLQVFEPGAQGEHKIARGFIPSETRSAHWLNNSPYQDAIAQYVNHERLAITEYRDQLKSPYQEDQ